MQLYCNAFGWVGRWLLGVGDCDVCVLGLRTSMYYEPGLMPRHCIRRPDLLEYRCIAQSNVWFILGCVGTNHPTLVKC